MARSFRQLFRHIVPSWLIEGDGEAVLYSISLLIDAADERIRQGLNARFPSRTVDSANELTGRDRGILRGRDEASAHYAQRLIKWRYPRGHRVRGNAFALLEQFSEYWGGVDCWTIDSNGNRHDRTADGVESYSYGNAWDWGDGGLARFWVVLDLSATAAAQDDYGATWGQTGATYNDASALRGLMGGKHPWKPAGSRAEWVIVKLDASDPDPVPDDTWLHWSQNVAGTQTPTRDSAYRYWSLTPERNNVYAGDPDNFPETFLAIGGGTFDGDPTSFPTAITRTDGTPYAGNPDNFPALLRLVDDGDPTS